MKANHWDIWIWWEIPWAWAWCRDLGPPMMQRSESISTKAELSKKWVLWLPSAGKVLLAPWEFNSRIYEADIKRFDRKSVYFVKTGATQGKCQLLLLLILGQTSQANRQINDTRNKRKCSYHFNWQFWWSKY